MPKSGQLQFTDFDKPRLDDGNYTLTIEQTLTAIQQPPPQGKTPTTPPSGNTLKLERTFEVAGPKYSLPPGAVLSVFPPKGNLGGYANAFAHVILERSMLPWERSGWVEPDNHWKPTEDPPVLDPLPWLLILTFPESEAPTPISISVAEFNQETNSNPQDEDYNRTTVIDIPNKILSRIIPLAADLKYLAHVRQEKVNGKLVDNSKHSVVIGNQLAQPDVQNFVYLVSVEGRYDEQGYFTYDPGGKTRLISLLTWSFSPDDRDETFPILLQQLNRDPSTLQLPPVANPGTTQANNYLSQGFVPLPQQLRESQETVSWYHGPLIPETRDTQLPEAPLSSDTLMIFDPKTGLFDISYAAAWELGRLLGLESGQFSQALYNYRQQLSQQKAQKAQLEKEPNFPIRRTAKRSLQAVLTVPDSVTEFLNSLWLLEGVPFNYLVPDERMLPAESMRFFKVDYDWVRYLLQGAFSLGNVGNLDSTLPEGDYPEMTGVLIRSAAIAGWPNLTVRGYSSYEDLDGHLPVKRPIKLSSDVFLYLFDFDLQILTLIPKPGIQHFAVEPNLLDPTLFHRTVRGITPTGSDPDPSVPIPFSYSKERVVNVHILAHNFAQKLGQTSFSAREYAWQMLETAKGAAFINTAAASDITYSVNPNVITPSKTFIPTFTIISSASPELVTMSVQMSKPNDEPMSFSPFGVYQVPENGAINEKPPGSQEFLPGPFKVGTRLTIIATSWRNNNEIMEEDIISSAHPNNILLLQNGDSIPPEAERSIGNQLTLRDYLNGMNLIVNNKIQIGDNQIIYAFELSTTDLNSPDAGYKDAVFLVSLYPVLNLYAKLLV